MDNKKPIVPILAALLAVAVGVIVYLVASGGNSGKQIEPSTTTVSVPDVEWLEKADAEKILINAGFVVGDEEKENSDTVPKGQVISQDPAPRTQAESGSKVNLVISKGKAAPVMVTVPDLTGMTQEEAEKALKDAQLKAVPGKPAYSDSVDPGKVCEQSVKAGTQVQENSQVIFSISLGKETVKVPDVTGMTLDDARAALNKVGLGTDTTTSYSDKVDKDKIISQSVAKDTQVVKGTVVTLEVSLGQKPKEKVTVPDIYTYTLAEAKKALESAGLTYRYTGDPHGTVVAVDPEPGTEVDQGSKVSFTLQHHVSLVAVPDVSGMTGAEAAAECKQSSLELDYDTDNPDKELSGTDPAAGTMVDVGTTVEAVYAPDTVEVPDVAGMSGTDASAACDQVGLVLDYDTDNPDKELSGTDPAAGTEVDLGSTVTATYDPDPEPTPQAGGWQANTQADSRVTDDEAAIFDGAISASDDASGDDSPVAVLATQVVSGTNYAFLGYEDSEWCLFNIYVDLDGNQSLTSLNKIDLANIQTTDKAAQQGMGSWTVSDAEAGTLSPDEVQNAFDDAVSEYTGVSLKPIAYLGSQVVAGTNYKVLCAGAPVTPNAVEQLYVATIYVDTDGNASFSDVSTFDLTSYLS